MASNTTAKKEKQLENLIGPMDPALDREMRERLTTARVGLLLRHSFFGNLATRLKLINADEWCQTAATDGRNFYYNSRFIKMLRPKEVEFLFGHEVLHCVYDHFGRRKDRDPRLSNIAADYCVNADLKKHQIGEFITTVPCLYDSKYEGWSYEQVYDDLYENAEKISMQDLIDQLLDDHLDGDKGQGDGDENGSGKRPILSDAERQQIKDEITEAMLSAAQNCRNAGDIPAGVRRIIEELTEPKIDWRQMLRMQIESTIKADFTWMRPSRRGWHMDAVLPGMKNDEMIDIVIFWDTSGSMTQAMLRDQASEVKGIMEQYDAYRIHVATFDTQVHNPKVYTSDNIEDIMEYDMKGGGGTDFTAMYDYLKEEEIEPKKMIVFTDGYPFGSWGDENYCDVVWILHGTTSIVPPFGEYSYYQLADN